MRHQSSLDAVHRRLGHRSLDAEPGDGDLDGADGIDDTGDPGPSWVPDGLPTGPRAWLESVRADPGRAGGIALAVVAALAVLITVFTLIRSHPAPVVSANLPPVQNGTAAPAGPTAAPAAREAVVSVVGLVSQPGLVTLAPDARVADAVAAAGGPVKGADTLGLNLARRVADGEQIVVGIATPAGRQAVLGSSAAAGRPVSPAAPASGPPAGPVDLNTATVEQFDALPGIGPVTAAAIVAWRAANGRFARVDQLAEVDGIGAARLERLRPLVTV